MMIDQRDERLAKLLDTAVRDLRPTPVSERVLRRGAWRKGLRLTATLATVSVFVGGAIFAAAIVRDSRAPNVGSSIVTFSAPEAPWAFDYPSGWNVGTRSFAGPELRVNVLLTTIANGSVPKHERYGPNSSPNASSLFGNSGAVVLVERLWGHATPLVSQTWGPGPFGEDAQNPGWTFRERVRCDGTLCFHVVEWLGPETSDEDRATASVIADSARLAPVRRWSETDGELTTLHDEENLFAATYPADWIASDEPINTWVSSPFEILALATYPLRPGGEAVTDFQLPSNAIADLGPNDILVWVNEAGDGAGFPQRPQRFEPSTPCEDWTRLCPEPEGQAWGISDVRGWWLGFADVGRGLYVFVGMGEQAYADPARAQLAWNVLDSLRFLPR
jgi:hypothetical protein